MNKCISHKTHPIKRILKMIRKWSVTCWKFLIKCRTTGPIRVVSSEHSASHRIHLWSILTLSKNPVITIISTILWRREEMYKKISLQTPETIPSWRENCSFIPQTTSIPRLYSSSRASHLSKTVRNSSSSNKSNGSNMKATILKRKVLNNPAGRTKCLHHKGGLSSTAMLDNK
jgi:hypothetical protein